MDKRGSRFRSNRRQLPKEQLLVQRLHKFIIPDLLKIVRQYTELPPLYRPVSNYWDLAVDEKILYQHIWKVIYGGDVQIGDLPGKVKINGYWWVSIECIYIQDWSCEKIKCVLQSLVDYKAVVCLVRFAF